MKGDLKKIGSIFSQQNENEFLRVLNKVLHFSRWFGVAGAENCFWRIWGGLLLCMLLVVEAGSIWKAIRALAGWAVDTTGQRSVTIRLAGTVFYASSLMSLIICWRFSAAWPKLSAYWYYVDRSLTINVPPDKTLKRRMIRVTIFLTTYAVVEHTASVVSQVEFGKTLSETLKHYTLMSHGFLLRQDQYFIWLAIPLVFISNMATILWNYQDLLIVLVSMGLASRYNGLNRYVARLCFKNRRETLNEYTKILENHKWRKLREAYVRQAVLVQKINEYLGIILLSSSFGNFYFLCAQLFLGITEGISGPLIKRFYYFLSFTWLCTRVSYVILSAADVNVHSKRALRYLYRCQNSNIEIERLQNQLTRDNVILTGMGFFLMNRTILLKMAGAILTYELVLIQFDYTG